MDPIMRRAMGSRVGLLLSVSLLADARNGDAVMIKARVAELLNVAGAVNADAFEIMRPREMVREMGAIA
jgi:hypothetical protein